MLPDFTISSLHGAYTAGVSAETIVARVYEGIAAARDPGIFITLLPIDAVAAAARALGPFDPVAKPLWGIPFAVKDNIDVAGLPTTAACPPEAYTPAITAMAVSKLLEAGALLVGKTNLDQYATGLVGVRTPYPVPLNAIDPLLVPGGSSSGSAVAVARGIVSFALGTDTAGSGRVPAALNNIVGLKPSLGAVSTAGVFPACRTLDCVSVFAATVDDSWRVLTVMAGADPADSYSRPVPLAAPRMPASLRVGIPCSASIEFFGDELAAAAFEASLADLKGLGFAPVDIDLTPFRQVAELLYAGPWVAERYQAIREVIENRPEVLHPVTRAIVGSATRYTAADTFAAMYELERLSRVAEAVWRNIDVLVVPTIPTIATVADLAADPVGPNSRLGTYTNFVNLLDLAALAVPGRWRADKRPAGVTVIGPRGSDATLAALGERLHAVADATLGASTARLPAARPRPNSAPSGWHELAVVGAHMSGLALNGELTRLGAVFLRAVQTEPLYRLFALPGGPPHRPGLLRVDEGEGVVVDVEVWALPPESFGGFVAAIPAPLGTGKLRLADGSRPTGFLVEAEGTRGARDISSFGGWRHYLRGEATA
jgi:allophanate hydrolase